MTVLLRWLALDGVSEWWGANSEYVDGPDLSKIGPIYIRCILPSYWFCVKKYKILHSFWTFFLKRLAWYLKMSYLCIRFREQNSRGHYERVHWKIYIDSSSTRADALVFWWARLGRTLRTVGSPLSSYGRCGLIDTGEWNYDRFGCSSWWDNAARHKTFSVGFSFGLA